MLTFSEVIFGTCSYIINMDKLMKHLAVSKGKRKEDDAASCTSEDSAKIKAEWKRTGRRPSIFGACANPEDDDISDIKKYPKTEEQRKNIAQAIENVFLFKHLDKKIRAVAVDALIPRPVTKGEVIIQQGDDGDFFYVVETGEFVATIRTKMQEAVKVCEYKNCGAFGELALMYNEPRAATVTAISDGFLWALNGFDFRRIVLTNAFSDRKRYDGLLQNVQQLKSLTWYQRSQVCDALQQKNFDDGVIIFKQGDIGNGMYFVEEGQVSILQAKRNKDGTTKINELNRLGPGTYFGELALVEKKPRAATAKTVGPTKLAFLEVDGFERLLGPCMDLMKQHIRAEYVRKQ